MTIYKIELRTGLAKIEKNDLQICVVGVGTIGLPLATFLANSGFQVIGLDKNQDRVNQINSGTVRFEYPELLKEVVLKKKTLRATQNPEDALKNAEVVIVCVPTPLNNENEIDISNLINVSERIADYIKPGMLIVVESSVSIGTTRAMGRIIENVTKIKIGTDIGLSYCPERYNPSLPLGDNMPKIIYNDKPTGIKNLTLNEIPRVVGGIDEKSRVLTKAIYSKIIQAEIYEVSSIETAEATKLTENIFRDVNIALVNELAKVYPKFGLNIFEIIDAAKTKPFAFLPHYPGAGVGGECIPVDTWYLIKQAEKVGVDTKFLKLAREVNDSMPFYMIDLLEDELKKHDKQINASKISILGLAYKKNIHDIRLSTTFSIVEILKSKGAKFVVCDPLIENYQIESFDLVPISEAFVDSDAILLVTDHDIFSTINLAKVKQEMNTPIVIDGRNFFNKNKVSSLGFSYRAIGKP